MFKHTLKPPPKGTYTCFPHPNHPTLFSLMKRVNKIAQKNINKAPKYLYIGKGNHSMPEGKKYIMVHFAMHIIGAGQTNTTLDGGGFFLSLKHKHKQVIKQEMNKKVEMKKEKSAKSKNEENEQNEEDLVEQLMPMTISDLTIRNADSHGIYGYFTDRKEALGFHLQRVTVLESYRHGVYSGKTNILQKKNNKRTKKEHQKTNKKRDPCP
jgi:hypothetical protein